MAQGIEGEVVGFGREAIDVVGGVGDFAELGEELFFFGGVGGLGELLFEFLFLGFEVVGGEGFAEAFEFGAGGFGVGSAADEDQAFGGVGAVGGEGEGEHGSPGVSEDDGVLGEGLGEVVDVGLDGEGVLVCPVALDWFEDVPVGL